MAGKTSAHKRQTVLNRIFNPNFIMVYAAILIFLIIYAFGAAMYGKVGFTTLRTFINMFIDNSYYGISAVTFPSARSPA